MTEMDLATVLPLVALLIVSGAAIGILAGVFGVGGGAISVPVFYETFQRIGMEPDVAMPLAVGTSLAMIVPTSILAARRHAEKGTVDWGILKAWIVPILIGVILGSVLAFFARAAVFQSVFVLVAGTLSIKLLFGSDGWRISDNLPGPFATRAYGFVIGVLASLMGVGGGAISNFFLTLHGQSMLRAVSTSAGVGVLIAIPGTIGYILAGWAKPGLPFDALGYVSSLALAITAPTALLTTGIGVRLAHRLDKDVLRRLFGAFFLLVCLRFVIELF